MRFESPLIIEDDPLSLHKPHIRAVASRVRHLGVGVLPMETVYTLMGLADEYDVYEQMHELRYNFSVHEPRPFRIVVASMQKLKELIEPMSTPAIRLLSQLLPGPLSVVLPANDDVPAWMCDEARKIRIRIPQHPLALALARELDRPIATTRAAIFPNEGASTPEEVPSEWDHHLDFIWKGGKSPIAKHSTTIQFSGDKLILLRSGAYPFDELQRICAREGYEFDWTYQDRKPPEPYRVLFVCSGNVCRSTMAEGLLRMHWKAESKEPLAVASAGLETMHSLLPLQTVAVMQERGIDVRTHRPTNLATVDFNRFDLILAMANDHIAPIYDHLPDNIHPVITKLSTYPEPPETSAAEIGDPGSNSLDSYREIRRQIEDQIVRIIPHLQTAVRSAH